MADKNIDFNNLLEKLQAGIFRSTAGSRAKFTYVNAGFRYMLGIKTKNVEKISLSSIFVDRRKYRSFVKMLEGSGHVYRFEAKLKPKTGHPIWCTISATAINSGKGRNKFYDAVIEDITEQKQFEKQLIDSKELFQTVFNKTAAAITVTD